MTSLKKPVVWSIAGSDCSGGAGIQGDLLTIQDLGCHGCTLVTALTAQNSVRLASLGALSAADVAEQWQVLEEDIPADAIKIGMLANEEQIVLMSSLLPRVRSLAGPPPFVVWDPVLSASVGGSLSTLNAQHLVHLAQYVDVVTPNVKELSVLTGVAINNDDDVRRAANVLLASGCRAVLVKGGHKLWYKAESQDVLFTQNKTWEFTAKRVDTQHGHGTGCCLSSAIACGLALGYDLVDAVCIAKAYVTEGLTNAYAAGEGAGPLAHKGWPCKTTYFPYVALKEEPLPVLDEGFLPLLQPKMGLYPVVDSPEWIARLLKLGVKTIQLRVKQPSSEKVASMVEQAVALGKQHGAQLFINDHWELAIKHGAFGVHLGQEDLAKADISRIQKAGLRLGVSTHGYSEVMRVLPIGPSYIALGHIFPTRTKDMPSKPQGTKRLHAYRQLTGDIPTVAIGGINAQRIHQVVKTGVDGVALVTAITEATDPESAAKALMEAVGG